MAAAAAVRLWEAALKQINKLPVDIPSEQQGHDDYTLCTFPQAAAFEDLLTLSPAVWKKLVVDLKVPQQLGQAAASASHPSAPRASAAVYAVGLLLYKARDEGVLSFHKSPNSLTQSLFQQLSTSGFIAVLPRMLDAAAAALTAAQHEPGLANIPQLWQSSKAPKPPAAPSSATGSTSTDRLFELQETSRKLLLLVATTVNTCPQLPSTLQLREGLLLPALRLCMAAMQHCSRCADLLPADAAGASGSDPPALLEQLTAAAWRAGQAVFTAWSFHQPDYNSVLLHSADALRAVCMLLLAPAVCPEGFTQQVPQGRASTASSKKQRRRGTAQQTASSLAAWQFACTHSPELPAAQQRALQELGCSGRLFMFVAGYELASSMGLQDALLLCVAYTRMADALGEQCSMSHSLLDRADDEGAYRRQLAEALSCSSQDHGRQQQQQLHSLLPKVAGCCSSMLPCAPLFWLMPAVTLQWLDRQQAVACVGSEFESMSVVYTTLDVVRASAQVVNGCSWFWAKTQGIMLNASECTGQQGALFSRAAQAAAALRAKWVPPAPCVVQLLQIVSSTAARIMALCAQGAQQQAAATHSRSSRGPGARGSSTGRQFDLAAALNAEDDCSAYDFLPHGLSLALPGLLQMASGCLWSCVGEASSSSSGSGSGRSSMPIVDSQEPQPVDWDSLASLCVALQQTMPQLSSLMEAATRTMWGQEDNCLLATLACGLPQEFVANQGLLLAVGLQLGNPVLKSMLSLCFTVLKTANLLLSKPCAGSADRTQAGRSVNFVSCFVSLVLQATCAVQTKHQPEGAACSSSSSIGSARSSMVGGSITAAALLQSNVCQQVVKFPAAGLSAICSVCDTMALNGCVGAATKPLSKGSSSSGGGGSGGSTTAAASGCNALAVLPWLVCLGRCCLARARVVKQAASGSNAPAEKLSNAFNRYIALQEAVAVLPGWLQNSSVSSQLSAAGYDLQPVLELLAQLQAVLAGSAKVAVLMKELQALGLALSSLPVGCACNNPLCQSLAGNSEQQLVTGSSRRCSGCRTARYCSPSCQTMHWRQHKPVCKAIAKASNAAKQS